MEKRAWTARGTMTEADKAVIRGLVEKNKVAARIFVTGEVHESYIGDAATRLLVNVNDTLYKNGAGQEPLFVQTRAGTVRMTRFEPEFVWRCFHPDTLVGLVEAEAARLGVKVDAWGMDKFDFYETMADEITKGKEPMIPVAWKDSNLDYFFNAVYLSCLLLFHKPGYMDVSAAEHFALPETAEFMKTVDFRELNMAEKERLEKLRSEYGGVQALTNPEIHYIIDLYQRKVEK